MGNTISNCCQLDCEENSSSQNSILHHNSKRTISKRSSKFGKKKNVRFVDCKKSANGRRSSRLVSNESRNLNMNFDSSAWDNLGNGRKGNFTVSSSSSATPSFIQYVKDINSIFALDGMIGDGKFGTVFLAHPLDDLNSNVAIKLIPQKSFSHRIEKELLLLKSIEHENVIRYISAYADKEYFYIVTEYCDGGELFKKVVDNGRIDEMEAWGIIAQLLSSVEFLHNMNICHRDLKPENILFKSSQSDQIKIIDFGLSKQLKKGEIMEKKLGTPYYLAPEVLEEKYGKEVDLWSIGVITFVILWGYPPFYGQDAKELFTNIYKVNYEFWDEDWDFISDEAKDFISRLLVKDPTERMTSEQARNHPWIISGMSKSEPSNLDELKSNSSDIHCCKRKRIDVVTDNLSRSAEWTTLDSYEKSLF